MALAAVPVALSSASAVAGNFPSTESGTSAEAAELQAELEATAARHRAARKRCSEADAAIIWPAIPETLFRQPTDVALFPFDRTGREPDTAAQARALHMRRELREGLDHGLALMDALDLSPRGLDLMDRAIAQLDALEAPNEDLEPWLAGYQNLAEIPLDAEDDSEEDEGTSLETFGRGFVRCGADDAEDDDPAERDEKHGSEDEDHPWRCDPSLVAFAVQVAHG